MWKSGLQDDVVLGGKMAGTTAADQGRGLPNLLTLLPPHQVPAWLLTAFSPVPKGGAAEAIRVMSRALRVTKPEDVIAANASASRMHLVVARASADTQVGQTPR